MAKKRPIALELKDVKKHYMMGDYKLEVLKDIDLQLEEGEFVSIMGQSGSGKSTLLHILGLLDVPSSGSVKIDGKEASKLEPDELAQLRGRKIGFVFQFFYLIQTLSALKNVELPLLFLGVEEEERQARAVALLERVGLDKRLSHKPRELSGGERQRVAIARALANKPQVLMADEPTGNLDSKSGAEIMKLFDELQEEEKKMTMIMVTHDLGIAKHSHKIIRLKDGVVQKIEKIRR